jgi:hypothetical protein
MTHPATKKRGADPHVPVPHVPAPPIAAKAPPETPEDAIERKLEQGLEESMAGSDPVSVTPPTAVGSFRRKRANR